MSARHARRIARCVAALLRIAALRARRPGRARRGAGRRHAAAAQPAVARRPTRRACPPKARSRGSRSATSPASATTRSMPTCRIRTPTIARRCRQGNAAVRQMNCAGVPRLRPQGRHGARPHRHVLALRRLAGRHLQVDLRGTAAGHAGVGPRAAAGSRSGSSWRTSSRRAARIPAALADRGRQGDLGDESTPRRAARSRAGTMCTECVAQRGRGAACDPCAFGVHAAARGVQWHHVVPGCHRHRRPQGGDARLVADRSACARGALVCVAVLARHRAAPATIRIAGRRERMQRREIAVGAALDLRRPRGDGRDPARHASAERW